jgi:hypothetical protein
MTGNLANLTSLSMFWLWAIGVVILGIAIGYGLARAGRLHGSERARLDQRTAETQRQEDPKRDSTRKAAPRPPAAH